jgi:hypothetical protein
VEDGFHRHAHLSHLANGHVAVFDGAKSRFLAWLRAMKEYPD